MKLLNSIFYIILLIGFNSCLISRFKFDSCSNLKNPIKTEFCNLPQFDSTQLVKVKAIFSGVEEYWGLHYKQACEINQQVNFYFDDENSKMNTINAYLLNRRLRKLYNDYSRYTVEIEIIGNFQSNFQTGFGHLGIHKFQLNAKKVRIIRFINEENRKNDLMKKTHLTIDNQLFKFTEYKNNW